MRSWYQVCQFISNNSIDLARGCLRGSVAKQCNSMGAVRIHFHFLEAKAVHQKRTWCSRIILAIRLQHGLNGYDRTIPLYVCKTRIAILHHIPNQCSGEQRTKRPVVSLNGPCALHSFGRQLFGQSSSLPLAPPPPILPNASFRIMFTQVFVFSLKDHLVPPLFLTLSWRFPDDVLTRTLDRASFSLPLLLLPALLPLLLLQLLFHLLPPLHTAASFSLLPPTPNTSPRPSARSDNSSVLTHEARYSSACCVH